MEMDSEHGHLPCYDDETCPKSPSMRTCVRTFNRTRRRVTPMLLLALTLGTAALLTMPLLMHGDSDLRRLRFLYGDGGGSGSGGDRLEGGSRGSEGWRELEQVQGGSRTGNGGGLYGQIDIAEAGESSTSDQSSTEHPYLLGPPTTHFRDNLRPELQYITSWPSSGWTNDVIAYGNLLYLAKLSSRIAVLPHFLPTHIGVSNTVLPFSEVFDLPLFTALSAIPAVEWHEVKNYTLGKNTNGALVSGEEGVDEVGCWSTWMAAQDRFKAPRASYATKHLGLDISYTPAPPRIKLQSSPSANDKCTPFDAVAALTYPSFTQMHLAHAKDSILPSEGAGVRLPPDAQMMCFDLVYYLCSVQDLDFQNEWSPAWRFAMQHMHWTPRVERIAMAELRRALGVDEGGDVPAYISIHARRGDFVKWCAADVPKAECLAPLSAYARHVGALQQELSLQGVEVEHVVMTSDERDEEWWREVTEALGWKRVDHKRTSEVYGSWYPVIIDAVIQSSGTAFVGTDHSTMSLMAKRRVETWHGGMGSMVKWGKVGADDGSVRGR